MSSKSKQLFVAFTAIYSPAAFAYLDPGAGSYTFQIAIGVIAVSAFVIKNYWGSIKMIYRKIFSKQR